MSDFSNHNQLSLSLISEDQLVNLSQKYPWCSAAQFFLFQQYKKNNSFKFEKQAEKMALFFSDVIWLKWQLHLLSGKDKEEKTRNESVTISKKNEEDKKEVNRNTDDEFIKNTDDKSINDDEITFEPLHATDYFASQGIKISPEFFANDKLSSQVKSFTQWLKSMKKIHKENLPAADNYNDELADKKIQSIAEKCCKQRSRRN